MIVAELFYEFRNLPHIDVISPVNWFPKPYLSTNDRFNLTCRNLAPTRLPAPSGGTAPVVAIGDAAIANGVWRHGSIADRAQDQTFQMSPYETASDARVLRESSCRPTASKTCRVIRGSWHPERVPDPDRNPPV